MAKGKGCLAARGRPRKALPGGLETRMARLTVGTAQAGYPKTQLAAVFSKLGVRGRTRVAALLNR